MAASGIAQTKPVVVLMATGGTIAMKVDPVKHAPVPALSGEDLLATVPEASKYATIPICRYLCAGGAPVAGRWRQKWLEAGRK